MLLYTVSAALVFTNLLLLCVYIGGCDGLLFTWVPLQTAIITITFLLNTEITLENLLNTLYFNFGTHLIPVLFLIVFVVGLKTQIAAKANGNPDWNLIWFVAAVLLISSLTGLYFFQNHELLLICGIVSIGLNFINVQTITFDSSDSLKVTWTYVVLCNIFTFVSIYGLDLLVLNGYEKLAAVVSSIPLISVMVLAQSTIVDGRRDLTLRHILMLAAQLWPSVTYIAVTILCLELEWTSNILVPSLSALVVVAIQYILFKRAKARIQNRLGKTVVKYNFIERSDLRF